ncbi:MAG: fold hydrolase [Alphaproteobacteria bacterium]|nr:fold hydrolase [Alphaproteobacteria bacterium]
MPEPRPGGPELLFLALGGAGEIGMNLNLYGYDDQWLMLDLGITFGDETAPGVDVIMPDPAFIVERRDKLLGVVLTHAHEDHLGAVAHLWPQLRCPIFATPFAASVLRRKLTDANLINTALITEVPLGGKIKLGPFDIELITMTHSIPEPNAVAIRTPLGTILHTGDWKIDPEPLLGEVTDEAALRKLGDDGVLAMVCDSTNVFVPGEAGSEAEVRKALAELIGQCKQRVAVTCFASNLARVESVAHAADANGRHPVLVGRALNRMVEAARENGYLGGMPRTIDEKEAAWLPPDKVLMICTGSQGENGAAMHRLAYDEHPTLHLERGDTVIFSSRIIPGNEKSIGRLHNRLVALGVEVLTERDAFVHVSGHPARDELTRLYQWVRPKVAIPVHGELRHLNEHAQLARAVQVPEAIVAPNGTLVRLAPGNAGIIDHIPTGRLGLDGNRLIRLDSDSLRPRKQMIFNGAVTVTLVADASGKLLATPRLSVHGFPEGDDLAEIEADAAAAVAKTFEGERLRDDNSAAMLASQAVRRVFKARTGKRPVMDVQIVRI